MSAKDDLKRTKRLLDKLETVSLDEWECEERYDLHFVIFRNKKRITIYRRHSWDVGDEYYLRVDSSVWGLGFDQVVDKRLKRLYNKVEKFQEKKSDQDRVDDLESIIENFNEVLPQPKFKLGKER